MWPQDGGPTHGQAQLRRVAEADPRHHRQFLEIETRGGNGAFAEEVGKLGIEWAMSGESKIKVVLPDGFEIRELYRIAGERDIQIRRLNRKQDSLQDIFMKAMEDEPGGGL